MATLNVPITKAKTTLEVDLDKLPEEVYKEVVLQGLKVLLNRGASKVTKDAFETVEAMQAEALAVGSKQLEAVYAGSIRFTGGKAKKASGEVMTEARRLAKALVKQAIKNAGGKVSHYEASDITKAANALLDTDQGKELIAQAEITVKERTKAPVAIDIGAIIHESPKLVAKAEKAKADKKSQLSAKQAGKVKPRAKGEGAAASAH